MTTDRQAAISDIAAFVDDYVEFYALDDGECYHEPTEHERFLIEDAINGLIADDEFEALMAASVAAERDELRAEVERLRAEVERMRADLPAAYQRGYTEALNDCIRNGGEQWARSMFADGGDAIDAARAAQEGE